MIPADSLSPRGARYALLLGVASLAAGLSALSSWRDHHALLINASGSLPNWAFFIDRAKVPGRGDLIFFDPPASTLLTRHFGAHLGPFGKRVYGIAGDSVTTQRRFFLVNGHIVAKAKVTTRRGEPLALGPTGVIPRGCYFVATPHPDSFDSRYAAIGWICRPRILGVGTAIL
ncbi:conjugal transfer protein TraF [Sphingomonas sp. ID1715]|uniref:S26 family signal peptidase n=1 Tax=Sphingomonas sp. ID1715 TaxID=1656898 RepID=UPI001487761C|nr:S26 family signal peptidase [Sphingomonas sp. ID1715]NNM77683.1 conjugal transfer protein TraF [Sphingomonas sp. ID1715]